ncbi:DUF4253 domain-containing protein [Roseateles amylovorans]|uniref:DUF4253 domain-containing protein n=1 Tax=Roseateles amylovorans TaxID=2978473 RepID=A0ABY6B399_9BURK|nr:DUF4253 domain-containing protein [Roseateles amylovorans]UXH79398.1 DUF4253 domain-containing protein [Roseateles amylovorans]
MDFPFPIITVTGLEAPARLWALRDRGEGLPVMLGGPEQLERLQEAMAFNEATPEEILAEAAALDPMEWLQEREQAEDDFYEIEAADWPEDTAPATALTTPIDMVSGEPLDEVYIAVLPARTSPEAAALLKIGGWNDCPQAHEHAALWRSWSERFGAEVACIADDVVEFTVARPPQTREDALALAREQFIYCSDIVYQGCETLEALAASLLKSPVWFFWWD